MLRIFEGCRKEEEMETSEGLLGFQGHSKQLLPHNAGANQLNMQNLHLFERKSSAASSNSGGQRSHMFEKEENSPFRPVFKGENSSQERTPHLIFFTPM